MNPDNNQNSQVPQAPNSQTALPQGHNTAMAVLSYIGPLVIVSYLVAKNDSFVKFHIKQGLVLFVIEVIIWVVGMFLWGLWPVLQLINLATLVLAIVGIINAAQGNEKQLPVVGKFADNFKF